MSLYGFSFYLLLSLFIFVCLFMILLVLIQKGRGGGLASAFGGAGGNTAFGSKTGDVLTWATSVVFGIFLLLAVVLNIMAKKHHEALAVMRVQTTQMPAPGGPPAAPAQPSQPAGTPLTPEKTPASK